MRTRIRSVGVRGVCALVAVVSAAACGGSSNGGGSALTPQLTTITGVTFSAITPGVGSSVTEAAVVNLSTGNTAPITSGYSSDTPSVATMTSAGVATGVAIGDVTFSVEFQGFKASKKVRVLPGYQGTFYGNYTLDSCVDTESFTTQGFCAQFTPGVVLTIAVSHSQSADLTSVVGQFLLGSLLGDSTGTVAPNGVMTYSGVHTSGTARVDLQKATITSPSVGNLAGTFELRWTDSAATGGALVKATIQTLARSTGGVATSSLGRTAPGPDGFLALSKRLLKR